MKMNAPFEPDIEHFRTLEIIFGKTPIHKYWQCTVAIKKAKAEIVMPVRADFFNPLRSLHGSAYCKALDTAMFFAANSLVADVLLVTTNLNIHFLSPISSGKLTAIGRVVQKTRRQVVADGSAFDETGRELARASGTFIPSSIALRDLLEATTDSDEDLKQS
jgi:uncharacterized protein (TIGR00369 family)